MKTKISELKEQIKIQEDEIFEEAKSMLGKANLTVESLREIYNHLKDISRSGGYIKHPFQDKYGEQLKQKVWESDVISKLGEQMPDYYYKLGFAQYHCFFDEPWQEYSERHETTDLLDRVDSILSDIEDGSWEAMQKVTVLTNRTNGENISISSIQEAYDLLEFIIKNKMTEFNYDW